jgi:putative membrane protein
MTGPQAPSAPEDPTHEPTTAAFGVRPVIGGVLMGLANLVPGVSGGTMLLAAGVYEAFVSSIAELSTLRIRLRPIVTLGTIALSAALAIVLLAGPTKELVVHQRWIMYSLFIGLTLGGVPLVWRMARPGSPALGVGAALGLVVMIAMALGEGRASGGEADTGLLVVAGVAGASAMVLPGISGGYLLLLLGQYVPILSAIDRLKVGLTERDLAILLEAAQVVVPVGIGIVVGVVGVSNLIRWLLDHARQATLGLLLGLLLGAVVGLWPFQEGVAPVVGDVVKGQALDAAALAELDPEDWPVRRFPPSASQVAGSLALVGLGLLATLGIDRMGGARGEGEA